MKNSTWVDYFELELEYYGTEPRYLVRDINLKYVHIAKCVIVLRATDKFFYICIL